MRNWVLYGILAIINFAIVCLITMSMIPFYCLYIYLTLVIIICVLPIKMKNGGEKRTFIAKAINTLFFIFMAIPIVIHMIFPLNPEILFEKIMFFLLTTMFVAFCLLWRQSSIWLGSNYIDGIEFPSCLVENGPYILVRNPIYLAQIGLVISFEFTPTITTVQSYRIISFVFAILVCLIIIIAWKIRIQKEESMLTALNKYQNYCERVPRILPTLTSILNFLNEPICPKKC